MKKNTYWFLLAGTLIMVVVMAVTGASLKTPSTPYGIVNLELASNAAQVNDILKAWTPATDVDNISKARVNTWLDFIFLFFYAFFLSASCLRLGAVIKGNYGRAGSLLAQAALLAGFLDILENAGMLMSLNGYVYNNIALLTCCFSAIKWLLVILVILYLLMGLVLRLLQPRK